MAGPILFPGLLDRIGATGAVMTSETTDFEGGECPWCDAGPFERPRVHAQQVHPEQWADYEEAE